METKDIGEPSLWIPETDLVKLAALGKLSEECGELVAIISRCAIQGIDGVDPDTGERNIDALTKEIADVIALSGIVTVRLDLDTQVMDERVDKKVEMKEKWLEKLQNHVTWNMHP